LVRQLLAVVILPALAAVALAAEPAEIKIGYLRGAESKTAISLLDVPPEQWPNRSDLQEVWHNDRTILYRFVSPKP